MGGVESCFLWPAFCCGKEYEYGMQNMDVGGKFIPPGAGNSVCESPFCVRTYHSVHASPITSHIPALQ